MIIERVNRQAPQSGFIGDQTSPAAAGVFDGLHTYNPAGEPRRDLQQVRAGPRRLTGRAETAAAKGRISTITSFRL
jgi:hypothetical protein